ncbi:MAG: hypothetical protein U1E25_13285 [Methylocystis sp.]
MDANARRGPQFVLVPFDRRGDHFTVAVARDDIDERNGRQRALARDAAAALFQNAFLGEFGEHALDRDPLVAGKPEGAGDFAYADLARTASLGFAGDEGENVFARRRAVFFGVFFRQWLAQKGAEITDLCRP